jgi:UDP-3-O-[3-hydroxymyristoyl] glucosamine N-acyltransferase
MLVSQEVLKSVSKKVSFHNLDETIEITDIEHVQNKSGRRFKNQCLYWLDLNDIPDNYINKPKGVLLVGKKQFQKIGKRKTGDAGLIVTDDPALLFFSVAEFLCNDEIVSSIHSTATVHPEAIIGNNVYIGAGAVVDSCTIGDNCILHSNSSLGKNVKIGNNTVIHSGANIGFNFLVLNKIHQVPG